MATLRNLELIDDIRTDAKILIENNPELSYYDAYEQAKKALIGDENIIEYDYTSFIDKSSFSENSLEDEENGFYDNLKKNLKDKIDVEQYSNEQLEQYMISTTMGLDISTFANPIFTPEQIKFLSIALVSGEDITRFLNKPNFNAEEEMKALQDIS